MQFRASLFQDQRTLRFRGADSDSNGQDASVRLVSHGAWQVDALAYVQARNFSNIVISSTSFRPTLNQRNTPSSGIGGKIELRPPLGQTHTVRIGVDARLASGTMYEDAYNANLATNPLTAHHQAGGQNFNSGAFVEDDWTIGPVVLNGGARLDYWAISNGSYRATTPTGAVTTNNLFADRSGTEFNGHLGARWAPLPWLALRAAAYSGFRLPTLNELYRPFSVFPVTTQANAALTPERLKGVEAGIEFSPTQGVSVRATAFDNRLSDAIANVFLSTNLYQRQNINAITTKGVEVEVSARHGPLTLSASYSYSDPRIDAPGQGFNGFIPAQTPRNAANGTLSWTVKRNAVLSVSGAYVSRAYEDDNQSFVLPPALTISAVGDIALSSRLRLVARVENIFNATVITRNQAGSEDLGVPRLFWIGIEFKT